jgi:hypothetical protein
VIPITWKLVKVVRARGATEAIHRELPWIRSVEPDVPTAVGVILDHLDSVRLVDGRQQVDRRNSV